MTAHESGTARDHDASPSPAPSVHRTRGRGERSAALRVALRVLLVAWLAFLLLGSLGDLLGIRALVELTDYRALFLR